jgi:hypothetical protein
MRTITWSPGTDTKMDQLFDQLRQQQYQDQSHRLWKNYSAENFDFAVALTIHFDDNDQPEMCSSIALRDCWPAETYRILNRLWKVHDIRKGGMPRVMSPSFAFSARSQIEWLNTHTKHRLYFISRETDNWEQWVIRQFHDSYQMEFNSSSDYKYLTCPNECDDSCWQNIIYNGNIGVLEQWQRRPSRTC